MNTANTAFSPDFTRLLQHASHCSRYARHLLEVEPELLTWLHEHYLQPCVAETIKAWSDELTAATDDDEALLRNIRSLRKRVMLVALLRDLGGLADLNEVMGAMTALAEVTLRHAQDSAMQTLVALHGQPIGKDSGNPQTLLVIGMGKLGGGELNVSSDIDLIFAYPEDGETDGARKLSNHEFFNRLARKLIAAINDLTADGYVFRVDMRLRPYGDSGALVISFAALEEYLETQGREWERYAWIKARVVSPAEHPAAAELVKLWQPFVFRRYLDFGVFESMRKLHSQIREEVKRRDRLNNVKLGPGGIREVEFIAQVFQLIRGGRDPRLRIRPTLSVLELLAEYGQLSSETYTKLSAAYIFLRNLEHRLQYLNDQQTQDMPDNTDDQTLIACGMGYPDYAELLIEFEHHRSLVSQYFEQIFSSQGAAPVESNLWHENLQPDELDTALAALGYANAAAISAMLNQLRTSSRYRHLPELSRQRLDQLIPIFIKLCAESKLADVTLQRIITLLESISRRASYLAFLAEYPMVLQRLVAITSASAWASEYLTQHPILLDELLDAREIYRAPNWSLLEAELRTLLDENTDTESQQDVLRQFQHAQIFHLLAMDLQGLLTLEILSDHLSDLADLILREVLRLSWHDLRKKHQEQHRFAIIAYGKLGGRELGYESDLDLIFLFDDAHPDASEVYAKLAQRINTMLGTYTSSGRLYETDLRLRPNGSSGLLVSSIEAFDEYQQQHAWVWEHQALTRARFSAGDAAIGKRFAGIRETVLRRQRDIVELRREVINMRQKMHEGHPNHSNQFDIKHDSGGMVDIEFIVQFLVLAHAAKHPELTANRGNLALLKLAADLQLIDSETGEAVRTIYRSLRQLQHQMRLNKQTPCLISSTAIDVKPVLVLWNALLMA